MVLAVDDAAEAGEQGLGMIGARVARAVSPRMVDPVNLPTGDLFILD